MNRVIISGFYGFHNIGDEAILRTLTQQLRKLDPEIHITVLSHTPEETMSKYDVHAVKRNDIFKVFNAIRKSDVLLSGGGSLLQDDTSARSIHYYLTILRMGLFLKKNVFLISNGIGPIIRDSNKKQVARVLNKVNHTTVRDFNSQKLLVDIGVNPDKISVSADMVIAMDMEPKERGKQIVEQFNLKEPHRKKIGIAVRHKDFKTSERKQQLVFLANTLAIHYTVFFVPFYYKNDTKIYDELKDFVDDNVYFINEKYDSEEFMSLLENLDILMGSRLHSLIFALVAEVPFIGISYDPKIENFMEMIHMKPVCSMSDFSPEKLIQSVELLEQSYEDNKRKIIESKYLLKERLRVNDEMLKTVL